MQVDGLVLERTPQALNEDVVQAPAPAVHGDGDPGLVEHGGELLAGELAALVGVEDLGTAMALQGLWKNIGAEAGIKGVGEPPGEHAAGGPVHHCHPVQKALLKGNIGSVHSVTSTDMTT